MTGWVLHILQAVMLAATFKSLKIVKWCVIIWTLRISVWHFQFRGLVGLDGELNSTQHKWFDTGIITVYYVVHMQVISTSYQNNSIKLSIYNLTYMVIAGYARINNFQVHENNEAGIALLLVLLFVIKIAVCIFFLTQST